MVHYSAAQFITVIFMCKYLQKPIISGLFLCCCWLLLAANSWARPVTLHIEDCRTHGAPFYIILLDGDESGSWQDTPRLQLVQETPSESSFDISIELPDGRYAARAYIDINQNQQLDTTKLGRPLEPFAISIGENRRNVSRHFKDSIFVVDEKHTRPQLTLHYPKASRQAISNQDSGSL